MWNGRKGGRGVGGGGGGKYAAYISETAAKRLHSVFLLIITCLANGVSCYALNNLSNRTKVHLAAILENTHLWIMCKAVSQMFFHNNSLFNSTILSPQKMLGDSCLIRYRWGSVWNTAQVWT